MLFLLFQNAIFYTIALSPLGRVAEWLNAAVLKTADASSVRGFESHPFRHFCPVDDLADVVRQMILSTAAVSYLPQ